VTEPGALDVDFAEASADPRVAQVPYSHLSVELARLSLEELSRGPDDLRVRFERARPWLRAAVSEFELRPDLRPRISTCVLVDDYFGLLPQPARVIPALLSAAADAGVTVDYLARLSGCGRAGSVEVADLVLERLVASPAPGTTGVRPSTRETGWLSNGDSGPRAAAPAEAMAAAPSWRPPVEHAAAAHSVFVDVELWADRPAGRIWSAAFLTAVWQLLRLGLLRYGGDAAITPEVAPEHLPAEWGELPPVVRLAPQATPFTAYQAMSLVEPASLSMHAAVRVVLESFVADEQAAVQALARAARERLPLPLLADRVGYAVLPGAGG
jgi:hypothetical protein